MSTKKIRVAHIITKLELGGAQQNTLYTIEHLPRDKYEVILISGCGGILDEEAKKIPQTKVYFVPELVREISPFYDFVAFLRLLRLLRLLRPDIIHTHSSKAGILARWASCFCNLINHFTISPFHHFTIIIHTFHGFGFNSYLKFPLKEIFIFLEQITALISTKLIAVSEENIKKGTGYFIGNKNKYVLIRSGIKIDQFKEGSRPLRAELLEKMRKEFRIQPEEKVVTMITPFKPQKAPLDFVRTAKYVKEKTPNVKFLLVGDGELRENLESVICNLQLSGSVLLPGWRRDIPEILAITDIFVLTSLWEGLPRTILEAMSSGKPVVATAVDGNREIVKNGITGFLVPPKEPQKIAEKVIFLLANQEIARKMGNEGKKIINTSFDIDCMVNQLDQLYNSLSVRIRK